MTETHDQVQAAATELTEPEPVPAVEERSESSRAMAGAVAVLLLMVPAAFVAGWRLGRVVGALRGF